MTFDALLEKNTPCMDQLVEGKEKQKSH